MTVTPLTLRLSFKDMTTELYMSKERVRGEEKTCYCILGQVFHALGMKDETMRGQTSNIMAAELPEPWREKLFSTGEGYAILCPRLAEVIELNDSIYTENESGEEIELEDNENFRLAAKELMKVIPEINITWIEDEDGR